MTGLLATDGIIVLHHLFQHIAVTNSGLAGLAAVSLHSLMQAHITHDSDNEHIIIELFALHQLQSTNQHDLVAVQSLTIFVNYQAAVCITIVGNAGMSTNLNNLLLQGLQMGGAAAIINIDAIGLVKNSNNFGAQAT